MNITTSKRTILTATAEIELTTFDWLRAERVAAEYIDDSDTGRHLSIYAVGYRIFENIAEERIFLYDWPVDLVRQYAFPLTDKLVDLGMPSELRFPIGSTDPEQDAYDIARWAARAFDGRDAVTRAALKTIELDWSTLWDGGSGEAARHPVNCGHGIAGHWRYLLTQDGVIS